MQITREHYSDTYSPVVQMSMVRLLLTLSLLLGMKSCCADFTLAFTQYRIDQEMYIDLPIGFDVDGNKDEYVLQLKKTLCGLKQAGLNWFDTLKTQLISIGFRQSTTDPYCFYRGDLILICYVDDCLIFCHDENKINAFVNELHSKFFLTDEGDVATYLAIDVKKRQREGGSATEMEYSLTQPHLTKRIIEFLALSDSKLHTTPAEEKVLLHKDEEGPIRTYHWSYRSVMGMLNYLCGTRHKTPGAERIFTPLVCVLVRHPKEKCINFLCVLALRSGGGIMLIMRPKTKFCCWSSSTNCAA